MAEAVSQTTTAAVRSRTSRVITMGASLLAVRFRLVAGFSARTLLKLRIDKYGGSFDEATG